MRRVFFISCMLLLACSGKSHNEQSARAMFDEFNHHNWKGVASYYTEQAEFLDPAFGTDYVTRSREQTASKYAEMEKMFPNIVDDVRSIYAVDDKIIVEFVSSGSSGDSIKFKLPICTILTFKDGLITRDATYYDQ